MSFTFFFKRKTIHIDCFTKSPLVYNFSPIVPAIKTIPDWWRKIPGYKEVGINKHTSMKHCSGFIDLYKVGFMIPMWCDLDINIHENGIQYQFSDMQSTCEFHEGFQRGEFAPESKFTHMKIVSPWVFSTKEDIDWLMIDSFWNNTELNDFRTPVGVLNFKHQSSANINLFIEKQPAPRTFLIPHQYPIAHVIPLDSRSIKIHNHLVSSDEYESKKIHLGFSFQKRYMKAKKLLNRKCPF